MTNTHDNRTQDDSPVPSNDRRGIGRVVDGLLIVATLSSAIWASRVALARPDTPLPRTMILDVAPYHTEPFCFVDATNVVHWSAGSADGDASFEFAVTSVPTDVTVFVHPDSLVEPLLRTIRVLRQHGAQRIHIAVSRVES